MTIHHKLRRVARKGPLTATYVDATGDPTDLTGGSPGSDYTFSSHAIGTASADRIVVVAVMYEKSDGASIEYDECTLGGSAMTKIASDSAFSAGAAMFWLAYPTGTTADIVAKRSGAGGECTNCAVAVWAVTGSVNLSVHASLVKQSGDASPTVLNINTPSGGCVIMASCNDSQSNTGTLTGVTTDLASSAPDSMTMEIVAGSASNISAEAPRTLTQTWTGADNYGGVAASFAP